MQNLRSFSHWPSQSPNGTAMHHWRVTGGSGSVGAGCTDGVGDGCTAGGADGVGVGDGLGAVVGGALGAGFTGAAISASFVRKTREERDCSCTATHRAGSSP